MERFSRKMDTQVKAWVIRRNTGSYAVPRKPLVTTALPGPRTVHVRLYFMSCWVWISWLNCTTTMLVIVSPY